MRDRLEMFCDGLKMPPAHEFGRIDVFPAIGQKTIEVLFVAPGILQFSQAFDRGRNFNEIRIGDRPER